MCNVRAFRVRQSEPEKRSLVYVSKLECVEETYSSDKSREFKLIQLLPSYTVHVFLN